MADLVTYAKTAWQDLKTAITAARLNNMEQGISDCASQINKLGDSVSRYVVVDGAGKLFVGWDANGPYIAVVDKDDTNQVSFRLRDATNSDKPTTTYVNRKNGTANGLWSAQ